MTSYIFTQLLGLDLIRRFSYTLILFMLVAGCAETEQFASENQSHFEKASKYSSDKSGEALLVWIDGELILEDYQNGSNSKNRYAITEVSTLLAGLMALAAVDDGLLALDEPVSQTITEWQDDPQKSKITVSQLLHLTSGLEAGNHNSIPTLKEAVTAPVVHTPGEQFRYGPSAFQIFGILMQRKAGMDYLRNRILKPLDIKGGYWISAQEEFQYDIDITWFPRFFDGANLTAHELGRIGRFLLQKGEWDEKTIIKDLSPLTQATSASSGYGLGVWLNQNVSSSADSLFLNQLPESIMLSRGFNRKKLIYDEAPSDLYMAAGRSNQRLYVIPSEKMVIVRLGSTNLTWSDAEFLSLLLHEKKLQNYVQTN